MKNNSNLKNSSNLCDIITSSVLQNVRANLSQKNLTNQKQATKIVISTESAFETDPTVKTIADSVDEALVNAAVDVLGKNKLSNEADTYSMFTTAQKNAARIIASLAQDPVEYVNYVNNITSSSKNTNVISAEALGIDDIVPNISIEAYDGQQLQNSIYYSIAYNLGAARQDAFGEAFFPTITIDPAQSGARISLTIASIMKEFYRSITGSPDKDKFEKIPVVKAIYNNDIFATDKTRVVPVYREDNSDNAAKFVVSEARIDKSTGTEITTAPLKFKTKVSLLGISQTDASLSQGQYDYTDALDRSITVDKVYYSLSKDSTTEIFSFSGANFSKNYFVKNPQGHNKDMILTFGHETLGVNVSTIKTSKGAASELFKDVATQYPNYVVILGFEINGNCNTQTSDTIIYGNNLYLKEIRNAAGEAILASDPAYVAISAIFGNPVLEGYDLIAYRTNSNVRTRGIVVTSDTESVELQIAARAGITAVGPVISQNGNDNDLGAATVSSQIQLAGFKVSLCAVNRILDFANSMRSGTNNSNVIPTSFEGLASFLVNPYFKDVAYDLSSSIDSVQSAHRDEDIRNALRLRLNNEAMKMYTDSNYGVAFNAVRGNLGGKIGLIIGTDPRLKNLICRDESVFPLGERFEAHVVETLNPAVHNKIFMSFGIFDCEDRNSNVNILNFGNCFWVPSMVFEVQRSGNTINRELHNNPMFVHHIHLPILTVFNVSNVDQIFDKLPVYSKIV